MKKKRAAVQMTSTPAQPSQELINYIKQQLQQGVTKEVITNSLLSNGWQASDIERVFASLNQ